MLRRIGDVRRIREKFISGRAVGGNSIPRMIGLQHRDSFGALVPSALAAASALLVSLAAPASAQPNLNGLGDSPMVVELFTSQACSSCPPADEFAANILRNMDGVLPLGLHVDYWDFLGWKDPFSIKEFAYRQDSYAKASNAPYIYTPQVVIQGNYLMAGHAEQVIIDTLVHVGSHRSVVPQPLRLHAERVDNAIEVGIVRCARDAGSYFIQRVVYADEVVQVRIPAGENMGGVHEYSNVVRHWSEFVWDGNTEFEHDGSDLAIGANDSIVLILQERLADGYHGPIVDTFRVRNVIDSGMSRIAVGYNASFDVACAPG